MSNANTPSQSTIAHQSVKSTPAAKPAATAVSTSTDRDLATAASTATAEAIDSINDTDMTVANMSGARPASTSSTDKPTSCSDFNFHASPADSTTHALRKDVNADVANRPRPPQAHRPQRIRRKLARLLDCVHAQWAESEVSFGRQSPF